MTENSVSSTPATTAASEWLGPQTLDSGECGLFGWDRQSRLVFFATAKRAIYDPATAAPLKLEPHGAFPAMDYGPIRLKLGTAEALIEGTRYSEARLVQTMADGFERVQPLIVLQSCQTNSNPTL